MIHWPYWWGSSERSGALYSQPSVYDQMYECGRGERTICKDSSRWCSVVSTYFHGKKAWVYVCMYVWRLIQMSQLIKCQDRKYIIASPVFDNEDFKSVLNFKVSETQKHQRPDNQRASLQRRSLRHWMEFKAAFICDVTRSTGPFEQMIKMASLGTDNRYLSLWDEFWGRMFEFYVDIEQNITLTVVKIKIT